MKFVVKKEDLFDGIKIVERATSLKPAQPVFANILIETLDKASIRLVATDFDLTISTIVDAEVEEDGKTTVDAKLFNEIVSKLSNKLINFEKDEDNSILNIKCQNSKFNINCISAEQFPKEFYDINLDENESFEIELKPFVTAIRRGGFATAGFETKQILSGISCTNEDEILEIASTDGSRLARIREKVQNKNSKTQQLIIPARTLNELLKMTTYTDEEFVKIYNNQNKKIVVKLDKITMISQLLNGQYPRYNQLIPSTTPKEATVSVADFVSAIERVAIMVDEKGTIKLNFADNELKLYADTPNSGNSEEVLNINYTSEPLLIAFNYKYLLEALKNAESENIKIGLNNPLSATTFKPEKEDDYVCLIMPMQIK